MFTGLIETKGRIAVMAGRDGGLRVTIEHDPWSEEQTIDGESIAVSGICLTVASWSNGSFTCDVLEETVSRTKLASMKTGDEVNLERALKPSGRLGGHFVSGHIDGTGSVADIRPSGRDRVVRVACGKELTGLIVPKGSIACDGVSLTLSDLCDDWFEVCIIPETLARTTLGSLANGDLVNLEGDLIGKYVLRQTGAFSRTNGVTVDDLARAGFDVEA